MGVRHSVHLPRNAVVLVTALCVALTVSSCNDKTPTPGPSRAPAPVMQTGTPAPQAPNAPAPETTVNRGNRHLQLVTSSGQMNQTATLPAATCRRYPAAAPPS